MRPARRFTALLLAAFIAGVPWDAGAARELNPRTGPHPEQQIKIGRAMSLSLRDRAVPTGGARDSVAVTTRQPGGRTSVQTSPGIARSCSATFGNMVIERGARGPRDVAVIARGDVVSVCR